MVSQKAIVLLVGALVSTASAHEFLAAQRRVSSASVRVELNGVLDEVLGQGHGVADARLIKIHKTLDPLFRSLPKNSQGSVSVPIMRYAVRRYFSQEHAWILKGFEPHAELVNASESSEDIIQGKLPTYIRSVLEEKFAHDGFALDDVVAMVAAMERLAFDEVVRAVEVSFWLNEKSVMDALSHAEMMEVLSSYLITSMFEVPMTRSSTSSTRSISI